MKGRSTLKAIVVLFVILSAAATIGYFILIRGSRRDEARLDSMLATGRIDEVVVFTFGRTNSIRAEGLEEFLRSLHRTNRLREYVLTKEQVVTQYRASSGTNEIFWLSILESGILKSGHYYFRPKTWPDLVFEQ